MSAEIEERFKKKIEQLAALLQAGAKLTSTLDLKILVSEILTTSLEVLEVENSSLWLLDEEKGELVLDLSLGQSGNENDQVRLKLGTVIYNRSGRVMELSLAIFEEMVGIPEERRYIELAGLLHDVGKMGLHQEILDQPGELTPTVKKHRFLRKIIPSTLVDKNRYDGQGSPNGLKGDEIPISARIIAVADAFDSMTNDRPTRKAMAIQEALDEIVGNAGTEFDPDVVTAFLKAMEKGKVKPSRREGKMYYVQKDE